MLEVEDLRLSFGGVLAVDGLSFGVGAGEIVSVIGPNGAGKTSAFNCVTGFYKPTAGRIRIDGADVTGRRPSLIASRGVSRTFQNLRVFGEMSVLDNVRAGHAPVAAAAGRGRAAAHPPVPPQRARGHRRGEQVARLRRLGGGGA
ncbi:hypothetical protein GCM10029978_078750 [Actinoallomurus acanthiterrae]